MRGYGQDASEDGGTIGIREPEGEVWSLMSQVAMLALGRRSSGSEYVQGATKATKATQGPCPPDRECRQTTEAQQTPRNPPDFRPFSRLLLTLARPVARG